ncbi:MAG: threonine/serine exporter family protein [Muribaculaceae bacterium]|nr:threonine/serine exporter family protein [Muribaculaceae bacterium]
MIFDILSDAFFAAVAAMGFSALSSPVRSSYLYCALIAAAGHSLRFVLMNTSADMSVVPASVLAALVVGVLAVLLSPHARTPAETFLFPSLLPMIPGIYAYRAFGGLVMCLLHGSESGVFMHYFYLLATNGLTCICVILGMVVGSTAPIFILRRISFSATR